MQNMRSSVSEEIRVLMARRRTSQTKLAELLGRSQPYISRRMNAKEPWDLDDLVGIAAYFDVPVTDLFPHDAGGAMSSDREPVLAGQAV